VDCTGGQAPHGVRAAARRGQLELHRQAHRYVESSSIYSDHVCQLICSLILCTSSNSLYFSKRFTGIVVG
jgi:hypothetical protein